jgi:hypothetical protein
MNDRTLTSRAQDDAAARGHDAAGKVLEAPTDDHVRRSGRDLAESSRVVARVIVARVRSRPAERLVASLSRAGFVTGEAPAG